ncbi:hypothetical protein [Nakamurella multipartita]|uniref:hypothetical protein n=1 Tax=Nakamurella multipartita TaxID=53461 RepID=UPI0010FE1ACE|nr:hypothetical protein [Nakamurella multipartita]
MIGTVAALALIFMFSVVFNQAPIADQTVGEATSSLIVQTAASEASVVTSTATDASWQAVSATELDDAAGNHIRSVHVAVGGGWSTMSARQITTELWVRFGNVVRVDFSCDQTGEYLGHAEQKGAGQYGEALTPNVLCP